MIKKEGIFILPRKIKAGTAAVLCLGLFCFSGCGQTAGGRAQDTLEMLAGAEYEGRLYGTEGNEKALDYIVQKLQDYGFEPFSDDYAVPFETELPTVSRTSLAIIGDEEISFQEGEDFFSSLMSPIELRGTIPDANGEELLVACGGLSLELKVSQFRMGNSGMLFGTPGADKLLTGVSREAMDQIQAHAGDEIVYRCEGEMGAVTLENVMGVLKGKDSGRAMILGAHVDHMGMLEDTMYAGALDNASGVSALLAACRELAGKEPEMDIVVCFWNAEEESQQGSRAAAGTIEAGYESCCYINLDCIGMKDGGDTLITTGNGSDSLCGTLAEALKDAGCEDVRAAGPEDGMMSDHNSFRCPAVNIGQGEKITDIIHTPADTADKVDGAKLEQIAAALAETVLKPQEDFFKAGAQQQNTDELGLNPQEMDPFDYEREVRQRLAYDEYMISPEYYSIPGLDGEYFDSLKEAQKLYPGLMAAEQADGWKLVQIRAGCYLYPADGQEEEPGRIYKRRFSDEDLYRIAVFYQKGGCAFEYCLMLEASAQDEVKTEEKVQKLDNGGWLLYRDMEDQVPYGYLQQAGSGYYTITQGDLIKDTDGICIGLYHRKKPDQYTKKFLLDLVQTAEKEGPLVQVAGR